MTQGLYDDLFLWFKQVIISKLSSEINISIRKRLIKSLN